jgi:hypothetical protein
MVDMLGGDSDAKKHRDLRRTEIERSEANVVKVAESIFGYNPFEMEQKDKLYCISSGASATSEIEQPHCHPPSSNTSVLSSGGGGFICLVQKTIGSRNTIWNWSSFKSILRSPYCELTRR